MTEKYGVYYKILGILLDLLLLNFSSYAAYIITFFRDNQLYHMHLSLLYLLLLNFIWINVAQITCLYRDVFVKDAIPTIKQTSMSLILFSVSICLIAFFVPDFKVSNRQIVYTIICFTPMLLLSKIGFLLLRRKQRMNLIAYTRIVIIGAGPVGLEFNRIMQGRAGMGYRVIGFFDDKTVNEDIRLLGKVSSCMTYVKKYKVDEIYCALPDRAVDKINKLMLEADREMVRFRLVPDVKDYFRKDVTVKMVGHLPVISPRAEPLENTTNKLLKRMFDIVFSLLVIVFVMSWLLPVMALLIKVESRGSVFFKQLRSGKNNKAFYCLKFRSMYLNDEANIIQASKQDRRITKVGAFMRRTSIDEMPQFFNVLMGEMSVVGPRPHMLLHTEEYNSVIQKFMVRHFLLPGITGWAQVTGHRGETQMDGAMEARVNADIWYLENWSMLLDLKIIFLTVWQAITGDENAY